MKQVRDICHDIQTLDNAKRNLTSTITTLRRLSMLEAAIHQLSVLTVTSTPTHTHT